MPAAAFLLSLPGQLLSSSLFQVSCFPPLSSRSPTVCVKLPAAFLLSLAGLLLSLSNSLSRQLSSSSFFHVAYRIFTR
jgi:hypothetical protein